MHPLKSVLVALTLCLSPSAFVVAQETSTSDVARTTFVDRSDQQLRTLRREIEQRNQQTPLVSQALLAPVTSALTEAENALAQYKTASTFDQAARRADFESAYTRATERWNDFKASQNIGTPTPPAAQSPATVGAEPRM